MQRYPDSKGLQVHKYYKRAMLGIPIAITTLSAVAYMVLASSSEQVPVFEEQMPEEIGEIPTIDKSDLHSTLQTKDLYGDIRIKNGAAEIDDDMIGKILSKLINEAHFINYDGVHYNYEIMNATEVLFTVSWPEDGIMYKRNYLVNITKDI